MEPRIPAVAELQPWLDKLEAHPGSVVMIAIEQTEAWCNFFRVTVRVVFTLGAKRAFEPRCLRRRRSETLRAAEIIDKATHVRARKAPPCDTVS